MAKTGYHIRIREAA